MAAITTALLTSTTKQLIADHPEISFRRADAFYWSATEEVVFYHSPSSREEMAAFLHEVGHAVLGHALYGQDIELLAIERAAWDEARNLAVRYGLEITEADAEDSLDTYREWLHKRSRCPKCGGAGIQHARSGRYRCVLCETHWIANEAKICELRRYQTERHN